MYLKLCSLFERNTATGNRARSSAQPPPSLDDFTDGTPDEPIKNDDEGMNYRTPWPSIPSGATTGSSKRRKGQKQALDRLIDSFETANNSISSKLDARAKTEDRSKKECEDIVDAIRALPNVLTKLLVKAVRHFDCPDHRLLFFALNDIERRTYLDEI